jgi:squalene synthase HpnC
MARYHFPTEWQKHGSTSETVPMPFVEASAYCQWMAKSQYENFVVGSLLLPRELQSHFFHIYAFCRWADDLGDELVHAPASLDALQWWRASLEAMYAGNTPQHPILIALQPTVRTFDLPIDPFLRLISAFEQDQRVTRYQTFAELLDYCTRSANPVGELVLRLFRQASPENIALSDEVCTGLQLANFWQDVRRDFDKGRIYLPREDLERFGCLFPSPLEGEGLGVRGQLGESPTLKSFPELIRFQVERTAGYFQRGRSLILNLPNEYQSEIDLIIRGGEELLARIAAVGYDTWTTRPRLSKWTQANLLLAALWRRYWRPRSVR